MKSHRNSRRRQRTRHLETLEPRHLMAGDFRSIDGTGNNLLHPEWGSTNEAFLRIAAAEYADGISAPAGEDRPSAREVSNALAAHPEGEILSERDLSAFLYAWGQFLDHDIDLTLTASPAEAFPIKVPAGDAFFDPTASGEQTIGLTRSQYDPASGTSATNVRQQLNAITAFIDASMVYGSDAETAASLRTFVGGQLKTSEGNLLPRDEQGLFLAGDIRANENPDLLAMQTLFLREHNRLAEQYAAEHPEWTDEQLYQHARRIVAAEIQAITYNEFLPALLGRDAIRPYRGYRADVNPGIANEFATAAYRLGHSMLGSEVEFLDNDGQPVREPLTLRDAFFNTEAISEVGIDPILKALASDRSEEIDTRIIDDVRNFLFGPPGAGGFDLAALNIQRGRDHGLADYNAVRVAYGLAPVTEFAEITSDVAVQESLRATYGTVDNIDLWVGGLAEDHVPGASVGPLFQRILADQFTRLRDGDRFYYEHDLRGRELQQVRHTTLADVIERNTEVTNLQDNVFVFRPSVSGRVYFDTNASGQAERRELGATNIRLELRNDAGDVVATTTSRRDGHYELEAPQLGAYTVHVLAGRGLTSTSELLEPITVTNGGTLEHVDIGLQRAGHAAGSDNMSRPPARPRHDEAPPAEAPATPREHGRPHQAPPPVAFLDPQLVDAVFGGSTNHATRPRR